MVGASQAQHKLAGRRWRSLLAGGYGGALYPVNPSSRVIRGIRAYASLDELPEQVDLAVIAVPARTVATVVNQCADNGVRAVVVLSAGFAESGPEGLILERELAAIADAANILLIGPNCAGIVSTPARINLMGWEAPTGAVGLISQSGNVALQLGYLARLHGGGFSRIVSIGNACCTGIVPLTGYLLDDASTRVIIIYVEGWQEGEGRAFIDVVASHANTKPIILINPGHTPAGRQAAISHTGALAAPERVVTGATSYLRLLRTDDLEVAWLTASQLARGVHAESSDVYLLTDGGGHATLASDAIAASGLAIPRLDHHSERQLARRLPPPCTVGNPLDFAGVAEGSPQVIASSIEICMGSPRGATVMMCGHFGGYHRVGGNALRAVEIETAQAIAKLAAASQRPLLMHSVHAQESIDTLAPLRKSGVMVTHSTRHLGEVAGLISRASTRPRRHRQITTPSPLSPAAHCDVLTKAVPGSPPWLMEPEARSLLASLNLELPPHETTTIDHAYEHACEMLRSHKQIVLKCISESSAHKSDSGAVAVSLRTSEDVAQALERFDANDAPFRVLMMPMLHGIELAIGAIRDDQFGPCILLGSGGVAIELFADCVLRPLPIDDQDAKEMLSSLRVSPLLDGYRGQPRTDRAAIYRLMLGLADIMWRCEWIKSIDLNPVIVNAKGAHIADAVIELPATRGLTS